MLNFLGKPYEQGGRGPNAYDCYGLCSAVYRELNGVALPELWTPDDPNAIWDLFVNQKDNFYRRLDRQKYFCIIAFKMRPPWVTHLGVVLDDNHFIHILKKRSVAIERFDIEPWKSKIEGFYELITD